MFSTTQFYNRERGYLCKRGRGTFDVQSCKYSKIKKQCIPIALPGEQSLLSRVRRDLDEIPEIDFSVGLFIPQDP